MVKLYLITLVYFLLIDFLGIFFLIRKLYQHYLPPEITMSFNLPAAFVFYLIFILGLVYFVIAPHRNGSLYSIVVPSLMYGLVTYSTYALTVKAVFNILNPQIIVVDILWGMFLCLTVSLLALFTVSAR